MDRAIDHLPDFTGDVDAYLTQPTDQLIRATGARPVRHRRRWSQPWLAALVWFVLLLAAEGGLLAGIHFRGWQ
jgi:hypothetical protein